MKKGTLMILMICGLLAATGCCLRHEWGEATCEHPQTCVKCGKTAGEALPHVWRTATCLEPVTCVLCGATEGGLAECQYGEANYQSPATCKICGNTKGEALQADFEKYGLVCDAQLETIYPYTTHASFVKKYTTTGTVEFTDYRTFPSDDGHEALDGYEWKTVDVLFCYDDETAHTYGTASVLFDTDYYVCAPMAEGEGALRDGERIYTVNCNGIDYTECIAREEALEMQWIDGVYTCKAQLSFRVPEGYDGVVVGVIEDGRYSEGDYLYDVAGGADSLRLLRLG